MIDADVIITFEALSVYCQFNLISKKNTIENCITLT